jgi:DNA-binding Lrp family transcriptional regulator
MKRLDLKDRKILYELDINSRQSFNELSKKVGLSKDSVIYRIKKLQDSGIIKHFHTVIDVGKLGFISFRLYLKLQNSTPQKEAEIIKFLKSQKIVT